MNDSTISRANLNSPPIAILGVPFDNVTASEIVARVDRMLASRRPHYLATANANLLVQAQSDAELRRAMLDANLMLGGGVLLGFASRLLGSPLPDRVVGSGLMPLLGNRAAAKQYRLFLLCATQESAGRTLARLKSKYPKLNIAGCYAPPFNRQVEMDHDEIKRRVEAVKPDILLVSLGRPTQEKWIATHYQALAVPVTASVGTTYDFFPSQVARPPGETQPKAPEWLLRPVQITLHLFRRFVKDRLLFVWAILLQWWKLRAAKTPSIQFSSPVQAEETWRSIKIPERLDAQAVRDDALLLEQALADGRHCMLEMADVKFIDSTGVGLLIRLQKRIHATGRQLVLLAPSPMAIQALKLMQLQDFFATAPDLPSAQKLIEASAR